MTNLMIAREIKTLSGSFGAAAFVGQVAYWSKIIIKKYGREKFYKSNQAWHEELSMSRCEFDRIRSLVATRITKGMSKDRLMRVFNSDGSLAPLNHLILYWKDSDNKMWYWFNKALYKKISEMAQHPYGLSVSQQALGMQQNQQTPLSLNYPSNHINDDDDSFNVSDSGEFSLTQAKEEADKESLQDENTRHPQPEMFELLKSHGIRGTRLESFSLLKEDFIRAWVDYVNENSAEIRNKAAYLSSQLQSNEYPVENTPTPTKSSDNPFEGLSWSDFQDYRPEPLPPTPEPIMKDAQQPAPKIKNNPILGKTIKIKASDAWNATYNQLELQLDRATFDTWLKNSEFSSVENDVFIINVHNEQTQNMLQYRLYRNVRRVLQDVLGSTTEIKFNVPPKSITKSAIIG